MQGKKVQKYWTITQKLLIRPNEEHTEDARKRAKMQEEAETEKLGRERNKKAFHWTAGLKKRSKPQTGGIKG